MEDKSISISTVCQLYCWAKLICYENETYIVLGQNYKIKCVGNLFIYCYKVFFEETDAKKLLPT